ncbi:MAG: phosphatidylglycerophosphatase A family protein [Methylophilaceae bacterium]
MTTLPDTKFLFQHPAHFLALGFGAGLAKKAPGTVGTLVGLPLFWLISAYSFATQLVVVGLFFIVGIYLCNITSRNLGVSDHGSIVWDEIVAMMLVLIFTPFTGLWWLIALSLFRLFDIWKPFPIRQCDATIKNGFGVMLDDVLAALYTLLCIKGIMWMSLHI